MNFEPCSCAGCVAFAKAIDSTFGAEKNPQPETHEEESWHEPGDTTKISYCSYCGGDPRGSCSC